MTNNCRRIIHLVITYLGLCAFQLSAETNYFVVAEIPDTGSHGDSYVLTLTNNSDIAHAKALISQGIGIGQHIVIANIAAGPDGINRDYSKSNAPAWSWHCTGFLGFADTCIEVLDGWPTLVESNVVDWIAGTGGQVGFWNYTVVAELPLRPQISDVSISPDGIQLNISRLTIPFTASIEHCSALRSNAWNLMESFVIAGPATNIHITGGSCLTSDFYRVTVH